MMRCCNYLYKRKYGVGNANKFNHTVAYAAISVLSPPSSVSASSFSLIKTSTPIHVIKYGRMSSKQMTLIKKIERFCIQNNPQSAENVLQNYLSFNKSPPLPYIEKSNAFCDIITSFVEVADDLSLRRVIVSSLTDHGITHLQIVNRLCKTGRYHEHTQPHTQPHLN